MDRPPILATAGPVSTTQRTRLAMLRDWEPSQSAFRELAATVQTQLLAIARAEESHTAVLVPGGGRVAADAALATTVPPDGHLLVLENGPDARRLGRQAAALGRRTTLASAPEDTPLDVAEIDALLGADASITHLAVAHSESATGIYNFLPPLAEVCARRSRGLIVDASCTLGVIEIDARALRFEALIGTSDQGLEGVPGLGIVLLRKTLLRPAATPRPMSLDLHHLHAQATSTGPGHHGPPAQVLAALAEALRQFEEEGGQPARLLRYRENGATLIGGMQSLGVRPFLKPQFQAPGMMAFLAPGHPRYNFAAFREAMEKRGFVILPGALAHAETFRVGCIGAIDRHDVRHLVHVVGESLQELGVTSGASARG
jgi:2-aminoethylphosphonate-pyruvate transaminase